MTLPDFKDLTPRAEDVPLAALFPNLALGAPYAISRFLHLKNENPHLTVERVLEYLWRNGGERFNEVLTGFYFHESGVRAHGNHCHIFTPVLGLALTSLEFNASYLECYRISSEAWGKGTVEQVPPEEEPDSGKVAEFCGLGRIPYCTLEVMIGGKPRYISAKHTQLEEGSLVSRLTPECHALMPPGITPHRSNSSRSAVYLDVEPVPGEPGRIVWKKQGPGDERPEHFCSYLRMNLRL